MSKFLAVRNRARCRRIAPALFAGRRFRLETDRPKMRRRRS
jgi:hypothetical protein